MSQHPGEPCITPRPDKLTRHNGSFTLGESSSIQWAGGESQSVAELLAGDLRPATGFPLPVEAETRHDDPCIVLRQTGVDPPDDAGFFDESYRCVIGENGVELASPSAAGLARAVQTLCQLCSLAIFTREVQREAWVLLRVHIEDRRACRWRGLDLNVVRHFFDVEIVCRFIELLAIHRSNVCHLHLHLTERGRRLIGWDEILKRGLTTGAAVMSWRGEEGGIAAARDGHDVVMAPSQRVYFDHYPFFPREEEPLAIGGMTSNDFVYSYQSTPAFEPELHPPRPRRAGPALERIHPRPRSPGLHGLPQGLPSRESPQFGFRHFLLLP